MHAVLDNIKPMILAAAIALGYIVHCTDARAAAPEGAIAVGDCFQCAKPGFGLDPDATGAGTADILD